MRCVKRELYLLFSKKRLLVVCTFLLTLSSINVHNMLFGSGSIVTFKRIIFNSYSKKQFSLHAVLQDSAGFMWLGTSGGLYRYDGYNLVRFQREPGNSNSLADNTVLSLLEDNQGYLWIGTGRGLNRYNRTTGEFILFLSGDSAYGGLTNNYITSLAEDSEGNILIGTYGGGINLYNKKISAISKYEKIAPHMSIDTSYVTAIETDENGSIYIGTERNGLLKLDSSSSSYYIYTADPGRKGSISSNYIKSLHVDSANTLWVGTSGVGEYAFKGGVNQLIAAENKFRFYAARDNHQNGDSEIQSICSDAQGNLWIGTKKKGLFFFDIISREFSRYTHDPNNSASLSDNSVTALYRDASGLIWAGTEGGGVNTYGSGPFTYYGVVPGFAGNLSNNNISSIFKYGKNIWIATFGGGLNKVSGAAAASYRFSPGNPLSLPEDNITAVYQESEGRVLVGTEKFGLVVFDEKKGVVDTFSHSEEKTDSLGDNYVTLIYKDRKGDLLIGTRRGLYVYNRDKGTFIPYDKYKGVVFSSKVAKTWITSLTEDKEGTLWIGTKREGLIKAGRGDVKEYRFSKERKGGLSNNYITVLHTGREGTVWIGTYGGGINRYIPQNDSFEIFSRDNTHSSLQDDFICGILSDKKNNLWVTTGKGLSWFSPVSRTVTLFQKWYTPVEIEYKKGVCYQDTQGRLYFGGVNGLNAFYPRHITERDYIPRAVFISLKKIGPSMSVLREQKDLKQVTLKENENIIELEVALLEFEDPLKNSFLYKLEGFDDAWHSVGNRNTITFTNLAKPIGKGNYKLRLKGRNPKGISSDEVSLEIRVDQPFYRTWPFVISVLLFILLLVLYVLWLRTRIIENQRLYLQRVVNERTEKLNKINLELQKKNEKIMYDLKMARKIQLSIMPNVENLDTLKGLRFGARYISTDEVGGDLFDIIKLSEHECGVLVADVTGHGLPAALISSVAKVLFRDHSKLSHNSGEVCDRVNNDLYEIIGQLGYSMTACYVIINIKTDEISFTNAAHPPAVLCSKAAGGIIELHNLNPIIGLGHDFHYLTNSYKLHKGDKIVFFTDGIIEAQNSSKQFYDMKRLCAFVEKNYLMPAAEFVDSLITDLEDFSNHVKPNDDIAIICLDYKWDEKDCGHTDR